MSAELRPSIDGATGGDPTQGAICFRLLDSSDEVLLEHAQQIGDPTSNETGYRPLMIGLSACQQYTGARLHWFADSELMVKQLRVRRTDPEMARAGRLAAAALRARTVSPAGCVGALRSAVACAKLVSRGL